MADWKSALSSFMQKLFPPPPVLREGSTGADVVKLQTILNGQGQSLKTDGIFGPKTRAAVEAYQRSRGLVPDSIVGPHTWGSLND